MKIWNAGGYARFLTIFVLMVPWQTAAAAPPPRAHHACTHRPKAGWARCYASVLNDSTGHPLALSTPHGYGPADFHNAYRVGTETAGSATIGIVVAYDAPHIRADLDVYDRTFGLRAFPDCGSLGQSSCFDRVDQHGGKHFPKADSGWALEASMDVEIAHAMCQNCRIVMVEAASASLDDLSAAVDQAVAQGARVVSNSYGGAEFAGESNYDRHYRHSGVTMTVSSGDSGYGVNYPAASPEVVAVGGTSLHWDGARVVFETAWSKSGSGCSRYEPKPAWQHDPGCPRRTVADIAADADPVTGAAVYDSYATNGRSGWFSVGGTSLAAPLVAGILAVKGGLATGNAMYADHNWRDIISGKNGSCRSYLCQSAPGYDGPTGLGVPNGT